MQFEIFPDQYRLLKSAELQRAEAEIKEKSQQVKRNIEKETKAADMAKEPRELLFAFLGILGAIAGGAFSCKAYYESTGGGFVAFLIFCGVSYGIFFLTLFLINDVFGSKKPQEERIKELVEEESLRCEREISVLQDDINKEIYEYKTAFESEARTLSVRFAESRIAAQIIAMISTDFINSINKASRGPYTENISENYEFSVYRNEIRRKEGKYNFYAHRCKDLKNALEQAALARAIASSVQQNIIVHFPCDPSGTAVKTDIFYSYNTDCVLARITYTAANGNYTAGMN